QSVFVIDALRSIIAFVSMQIVKQLAGHALRRAVMAQVSENRTRCPLGPCLSRLVSAMFESPSVHYLRPSCRSIYAYLPIPLGARLDFADCQCPSEKAFGLASLTSTAFGI